MKIDLVNLKEVDYNLQLEVRNWRNAPHVAKYFQIPYIDEKTHENWLRSLQEKKPKNIAFLIKFNEEFIGLVYFLKIDYVNKETDWGMYIYEERLRGLGLGKQVIEWSIHYAINILKFKIMKLEVLKNNVNAISLYEKNGFKFTEESDDVLYYELSLYNLIKNHDKNHP
jgi:diamine N-acetyltransferase